MNPNRAAGPDALRQGPCQPSRRLVLLHGWGADADDLLDLGSELVGDDVEVVALRAPEPHPAGVGRQWYDLQQADWPGIGSARRNLAQRFDALAESLPSSNTAVLGFSQGAAMAVDVASGRSLAALIACSGYPHPSWNLRPNTPILITHGEQDPVVPIEASQALEEQLRQAGGSVQRLVFQGGHGIDPLLLPEMQAFLEAGWAG